MEKRGQVTIFIIIAIVIVAVVFLAIILVPKILPKTKTQIQMLDPETYVSDCININLEPMVETLASQGGYFELGNCIFYKNICRHYLCYTTLPYTACINQEPLLKEHIEQLLKDELENQNVVQNCINNFAENSRRENWDVTTCSVPMFSVNLTEGRVRVLIKCDMTMTKGQESRHFEEIEPALKWPLYEFVLVVKDIINEEHENTDFKPIPYMLLNNWIKIEKYKADESKIYTLIEKSTGKEFVFAVRNMVIPGGFI